MMSISTFYRFALGLMCMTQFSDITANAYSYSYSYTNQEPYTYGYDFDDIKAFWYNSIGYGGANVLTYGYDDTINTRYMTQYYGYDDIVNTNYTTQYYGYGGKTETNGYGTNPTDYFEFYALSQISSPSTTPPTQDTGRAKSKKKYLGLALGLGFGLGVFGVGVGVARFYYQIRNNMSYAGV